ncbi:MAG TPA: ribonuclease H-like domain-containing protein [Geminicoccus sp.]|jgi:ribonuclease D|uniref:ribonuclease D n=1 Tax=Geminicoccus sp. TaxID=2024832 RepID=UPI002E35FC60|nr:ribonuclease H-like domain-containing protein [Geminicoccus sp.]HEX2524737.1 ribonuclease H-like domain-containing protein [Geminicoccus sp.]
MDVQLHRGDLPADFRADGPVAIDTETMGLSPARDRLCLIQLRTAGGQTHFVQFENRHYDAPRLCALLADREVLKIFHFARFDVAVLNFFLGATVGPIWCTKIASKLVRTYTDRHSLKELTREILGVELQKQEQSSDWGAATLTQAQLDYAAGDVLHLHALKDHLQAMLQREGRMNLAQACFDFLPVRAQLDLAGWAEQDIFAH